MKEDEYDPPKKEGGSRLAGVMGLDDIHDMHSANPPHTHTQKKEFQTSPDAISIPRTNCVHYKCKVCVCMHPHVDYIQKLNRSLHSITVCVPLLYSPLFFSVGKEMYSKETYSYRSIDLSGTTQGNSLHDSMLSSCLLLLFLLSLHPFFCYSPLLSIYCHCWWGGISRHSLFVGLLRQSTKSKQ